MPITKDYGYVVPTTGDKGSTFWTQLTNFLDRISSHNHDGSNSATLSSSAVQPIAGGTIAATSWVSGGDGTYYSDVTLPVGRTFASVYPVFRIGNSNSDLDMPVHPRVERIDDTHFRVSVNDNTISLKIAYVT